MESKKVRGFTFANVRERYRQAECPASNRDRPFRRDRADGRDLDCGEAWTARTWGPGRFIPSRGFVNVTCPNSECGKSADVPNLEVLGK
jgi:hypothetical protein